MNNPAHWLTLHTEPLPLRVDEGGAIRIGSSRVGLDPVVVCLPA